MGVITHLQVTNSMYDVPIATVVGTSSHTGDRYLEYIEGTINEQNRCACGCMWHI